MCITYNSTIRKGFQNYSNAQTGTHKHMSMDWNITVEKKKCPRKYKFLSNVIRAVYFVCNVS